MKRPGRHTRMISSRSMQASCWLQKRHWIQATGTRRDLRHCSNRRLLDVCWYENWSVVAVMLEKNVAIGVRARWRVVARSSSDAANDGRADVVMRKLYDDYIEGCSPWSENFRISPEGPVRSMITAVSLGTMVRNINPSFASEFLCNSACSSKKWIMRCTISSGSRRDHIPISLSAD